MGFDKRIIKKDPVCILANDRQDAGPTKAGERKKTNWAA
jgi:hypothetical protein